MARTYIEILEMDSFTFLKWLRENFPIFVPSKIETIEDMQEASQWMLKLSAEYSYITELSAFSKMYCRKVKRGVDKEDSDSVSFHEDMIDKRDAIESRMKAIHQAYQGISRAITVRMENNAELKMTGNRYVHLV